LCRGFILRKPSGFRKPLTILSWTPEVKVLSEEKRGSPLYSAWILGYSSSTFKIPPFLQWKSVLIKRVASVVGVNLVVQWYSSNLIHKGTRESVRLYSPFDFYKSSGKILKNPVFKSTFIFLDVYNIWYKQTLTINFKIVGLLLKKLFIRSTEISVLFIFSEV
jgi:hypothetical protein